jgi:hypothetical protein
MKDGVGIIEYAIGGILHEVDLVFAVEKAVKYSLVNDVLKIWFHLLFQLLMESRDIINAAYWCRNKVVYQDRTGNVELHNKSISPLLRLLYGNCKPFKAEENTRR